MNWRHGHHLALVALLAVATALVASCTRSTPEQALRLKLQEMQAAASEKDAGDFMDAVAEDFIGNDGMDRAALHNLLRMQMLANASLGITTSPMEVDVQGERATVRFTVLLTGGSGRFLPETAQGYAITSGWRMQEGEWHVYYAKWQTKL